MENHKFFTQKPCDKPAKHHTNHTRHETQKKIQNCKKKNPKNNSAPIVLRVFCAFCWIAFQPLANLGQPKFVFSQGNTSWKDGTSGKTQVGDARHFRSPLPLATRKTRSTRQREIDGL